MGIYREELIKTQKTLEFFLKNYSHKENGIKEVSESGKRKTKIIHMARPITFGVDFLSGLGWCNQKVREQWQFEKNLDGSNHLNFFGQVAPRVQSSDRQRFIDDVCVLDKHEVITKPYTIHNGTTFVDRMKFYYHLEDYEFSSPIKMEGSHIYRNVA